MRSLTIAVFLSAAVCAFAAPPVVRNPRALPRPARAMWHGVHAGNFGGDAAPDVLTINRMHSLQVHVNGANDVFDAPVPTLLPQHWLADVLPFDMDDDGDLDVLISDDDAREIVVYVAAGDGTFSRGPVIADQDGGAIAVADFTGDARKDIAVAVSHAGFNGPWTGTLTIHPANAVGGGYGTPVSTEFDEPVQSLVAFDANGDGKQDVLVDGLYNTHICLGVGDGTFTRTAVHELDGFIVPGDFDEDGKVDFAAIAQGVIHVYRGQGDGTFTETAVFGRDVTTLESLDVDDDGDLDLVAGSYPAHVSVFLGNGTGAFASAALWHTGQLTDIALADFDGDDAIDVIVQDQTDGDLGFLAGLGGGAFRAYAAYASAMEVEQLVAADLNGDGAPDLIADGAVRLNANDGSGTLQAPIPVAHALGHPFAAGDVNGDGKVDLIAVANASVAYRYLGNGDGTFGVFTGFAISMDGQPRLADLNGDHVLDLIITALETSVVYRGDGTGKFTSPTSNDFPIHAIGDVNGDDRPDVLGQTLSSQTILGINNGNGTFTAQTFSQAEYTRVGGLVDLNGDGDRDMLLIKHNGTIVRMGNGDGTFDAPLSFTITPSVHGSPQVTQGNADFLRTGDFDGDGNLDVAYAPRFYLGNGDGTFRAYAEVPMHLVEFVPQEREPFVVADFDGNGTDDLAFYRRDTISMIRTSLGPEPTLTLGIALASDAPAPQYAQRVTYTATLTSGSPWLGGGVMFARNGAPFALAAPGYEDAVASSIAMPLGPASISATYTGDDLYQPATATLEQTVVKAATALAASPAPPQPCGSEVPVTVQINTQSAPELPGPPELVFSVTGVNLTWRREGSTYFLSGLPPGTHQVTVQFPGDANYEPASTTFAQVVAAPIDPAIQAGRAVYANDTGYASALGFSEGATYAWTITNGTIVEGQGTWRIRYVAGPSGDVTLGLTIAQGECDAGATATVKILERRPGAAMFHLVTPCRLLDTRDGTILGGSATRDLVFANVCGIPADAKSVVVNVTAIAPSGNGWLAFHPTDVAWTGTSLLSYRTGRTRSNNGIVSLSPGARVTMRNGGPALHVLVDVTGYFR